MVKNYTNINKTNNHFWHQIIEHKKRRLHMTLEIQVLVWDRHKNVARVKLVNRIPALPSWQLDLQWQYKYKQMIKQTCTDLLLLIKTTYYQAWYSLNTCTLSRFIYIHGFLCRNHQISVMSEIWGFTEWVIFSRKVSKCWYFPRNLNNCLYQISNLLVFRF